MLVTHPPIQGHCAGLELFPVYYTDTAQQIVSLLDGDTVPVYHLPPDPHTLIS